MPSSWKQAVTFYRKVLRGTFVRQFRPELFKPFLKYFSKNAIFLRV